MDFESLFSKDTLAKIANAAPLLGSILGPGGAVAGTAIKVIASALGVEEQPAAIEAEIQANPEALLKLKELEANHKIEWEKLAIEGERLRLTDVQSARQRQIDTEKSTGKRDINLYILAWVIVAGFFILLFLLMKVAIPADQNGVIFMLFGALSTGFGQVLQYFFGSSKGSADKAIQIAAMGKKA
jgi:hypothetical protein